MKLASFSTQILAVPEDDPLAGAIETPGATRPVVTLSLRTDDGIEGIGVTFYGGALTRTLKSAVDQLCELCIGDDPHRVEAIIAKLRAAAGGSGPGGMFTLALAAIDIALWDIRGKALGLPYGSCSAAGARACRPMPAARSGAACRSTRWSTPPPS